MYFCQGDKQRNQVEFVIIQMRAKAFDINTPAGVCFAMQKKPKDINPERWIAMLKQMLKE